MSAPTPLAPGLTAAEARPEDDAAIVAFINRIQPHIPWTREHFDWQYRRSPAGPARLYVVRDGSRVVSFYAAVAQRLRHQDEVLTARHVQDVMTDPDYRGRGLLHHLASLCGEGMRRRGEAGYTFPNESSEKSFRRTGWTEWGPVPLLTRAVTASDAAPQATLASVPRFDAAAGTVWNASGLAVGVHRETDYLEWRYSKPGQRYERYVVDGGAGYAVLKHYANEKGRFTHICDAVLRSDRRELLPATLATIAARAVEVGSMTLTAWLPPEHPYAPAYAAAGFAAQPTTRFIFVMTANRPAIAQAATWHLTQGDSDVY